MADSGEVREAEEGASEEADFRPKRSKPLLYVALAVLLVAGGVVAFVVSRPTREPLRVLVAIDAQGLWWQGSPTATHLLENVAPHLKPLGFDVVDGSDAQVAKALKGVTSVDEAAARVQASLIVTGTLKIDVADLGKVGMFEVRAVGPIQLRHYQGAPAQLGTVHTWSGAAEKGEALSLAARSLGWQVFDDLLPGLMVHPTVRAIIEGNDRIAAGKLTSAADYLKRREKQLEFVRSSYAALGEKFRAGDASPAKVTLHTPLDRQDGLCAVGVSGFFVRSSAIRPFFRPVEQTLGYFAELDKLYWQGATGQPGNQAFEGYNVLGYPSATPDGTTSAYVEDLYGAATALEVVRGTAPAHRVLVDSKLRLSEPKLASSGALAAAWARECPRCPAMVVVVDLASEQVVHRSDPNAGTLGGFVWLGPTRLGILVRAAPAPRVARPSAAASDGGDDEDENSEEEGPSQTFSAIDFAVSPPTTTVLGAVSGSARLALPSASSTGRRVVFSRAADDGMNLLLFDDSTHTLEPIAVERAHDPAMAPGGNRVAYVRHGEIEVYDLEKKTSTVLTRTSRDFTLRYPQFSLDERRVYFEVRIKDPVFPTERSVSAVASVPVP